MEIVIVENAFRQPLTIQDLLTSDRQAKWCMDLYRVQPRMHILASTGLKAICVFSAPDAESLRQSGRKVGFAPRRIWSVDVDGSKLNTEFEVPAPQPGFCLVITQRVFEVTRDDQEIVTFLEKADLAGSGYPCQLKQCYVSADHGTVLGVYETPNDTVLRHACQAAGLAWQDVWAAQVETAGIKDH